MVESQSSHTTALSSSNSRPAPRSKPTRLTTTALSALSASGSVTGSLSNGKKHIGRKRAERTDAAGTLLDEEYEVLLPAWRVNARKVLVESLRREMGTLVWIQTFRTPARDLFFVNTSLLGTHGAFMICIPMIFWFGAGATGRGLLYTLALGGYVSSVMKDLFCVPRPFAPPMHRLGVSNHAQEYGFPSTHSTNSVSMALYFGELFYQTKLGSEYLPLKVFVYGMLAFFAGSVTFGRLYTGMHSMMDVAVGALIGSLVWLAHYLLEASIESYTLTSGWLVTTTFIPLTLFLVFVHPEPAENCPCFEDAIAFVSVFAGILVGRNWSPADWTHATVGAGWTTPLEAGVWVGAIITKVALGVFIIFSWRLVAKEVAHAVLPPVFRSFYPFLIHRRHYVAATEYDNYDESTLKPVPSILNFATFGAEHANDSPLNSPTPSPTHLDSPSTMMQRKMVVGLKSQQYQSLGEEREHDKEDEAVAIRRDADVLTKVVVYAGIGWQATIGIPWFFSVIGLSI